MQCKSFKFYAKWGIDLLLKLFKSIFSEAFRLNTILDVKELKDFTKIDCHFRIYLALSNRFYNFYARLYYTQCIKSYDFRVRSL